MDESELRPVRQGICDEGGRQLHQGEVRRPEGHLRQDVFRPPDIAAIIRRLPATHVPLPCGREEAKNKEVTRTNTF